MSFEDFEIGKCYSRHDDAVYKVLDKGTDWILVWHYSYNHNVCTADIYQDDDYFEGIEEETEDWVYDIFENLEYADYECLKGTETR